jgi:NADH dehydrogenase
MASDIQGSRIVTEAAVDANVDRLFFISHLGADRASAFPVLKAKAIAEEFIRRSKLDYTVFRTAIVYGPNDGFTTGLARLLHATPFVFFSPGDGNTLIQPLWIEDLVTCLVWALDDDTTRNKMYEIGGPEYFKFNQVLDMIMEEVGVQRRVIQTRPPYLRGITVILETIFPSSPVSVFWLDYLAANRTCALDTIAREFQLMPSRMSKRLAYLRGQDWRISFARSLFQRQ